MATDSGDSGERAALSDSRRGDGTQKISDRRWQEIIDVTAEILREHGYHATSIQDVADHVGILKGSLYYYIETKEDLLFAVLDEAMRGANTVLAAVDALEADAVGRIEAFIEEHLAYDIANLSKIAVFYHDHRALTGDRAATLREQRHAYMQFVEGLIDQGKDEGRLRPDVDTSLAARGLLGMMNWIYRWYRPTGSYQASDIAAVFTELFLGGLASDAGRLQALAESIPAEAADSDRS